MKANKIFFDLYSTSGDLLPYDEYKNYYIKNDIVYICLMDEGIFTKVHRQEMFDKNMHYGCFIEHRCFRTAEDVDEEAIDFIIKYNLVYTTPDEFIKIEHDAESIRVGKAFEYAERLIKEN